MSGTYEAGYGQMDGRPMYYEKNGDRLDIFPNGMPNNHHLNDPHDHLVAYGQNIHYYREGGQEIVNDRR